MGTFSAILIEKGEAGQSVSVAKIEETALPSGDVSIDVQFSTLNYKDGVAITGKSPVVRKFPMVPGIDLAGVVRALGQPAPMRLADAPAVEHYAVALLPIRMRAIDGKVRGRIVVDVNR